MSDVQENVGGDGIESVCPSGARIADSFEERPLRRSPTKSLVSFRQSRTFCSVTRLLERSPMSSRLGFGAAERRWSQCETAGSVQMFALAVGLSSTSPPAMCQSTSHTRLLPGYLLAMPMLCGCRVLFFLR